MKSSVRERFLLALFAAPLRPADAIVLLCGEDMEPRADAALQLFLQGGAPLILAIGAESSRPGVRGAAAAASYLTARGLSQDRVFVESSAADTWQQAVTGVALARERKWSALTIVASSYHLPRAFLTFVHALGERSGTPLRISAVPSAQSRWTEPPPGISESRLARVDDEFAKIVRYRRQGHVATEAAGLAHLLAAEQR